MEFSNVVFNVSKESERLKKLSRRYASAIDKVQSLQIPRAAVLLAIFQHRGRPHVILTERSKNLRTHAGQVALPGGKLDPGESCIDAALREAEEEIGLDRTLVEIVGMSLPTFSSIAKVSITPVIGFIKDIEAVELDLNSNEVESVFAVPLEAFTTNTDFTTFKKVRFPKVIWDCAKYKEQLETIENVSSLKNLFDKNQTYKIWGVTSVILDIYSALFFRTYPSISNNDSGSIQFMMDLFRDFLLQMQSNL